MGTTTKTTAYQRVAEKILEALRQGVVPWRKKWHTGGMPRSLASGKRYRGINTFCLGLQGYESPFWLTYRQAQKLSGHVKKGEKSSPCVFWKWLDGTDPESGDPKRFPILRVYSVFNVEQCEGIEAPSIDKFQDREHTPLEQCERVVNDWIGKPRMDRGEPSYSPSHDVVRMPRPERFEEGESYYQTLFHELSHATGHQSRLGRDMSTMFGNHSYSQEELIAEMASAILCDHVGILKPSVIENSAAYLDHWRKQIGKDVKVIVMSAAKAQKAADLILGTVYED